MRRSRFVGLAAALLALTSSLAACGGDKGESSVAAEVDSPEAVEFRDMLGLTDDDVANLKGETFKVGAVLPLSGAGSVFGKEQERALSLALDHGRKYLGLDIEYSPKDHKSGDPQVAAQVTRELGINGTGAVVASYYGVFGAMLQGVQQYKMLTFDPGGGTGNGLKGQDFYWGFRANSPDDAFFAMQYFKETQPEKKKVALVVLDAGDAYIDPIEEHFKAAASANGMEYAGTVPSKLGATDYSVVINELKASDPDIVFASLYGDDPGYFMKQYAESGLTGQVVGPEYVPGAADIAGASYDKYMFATDFVDVNNNPPNRLTAFLAKTYEAEYGEKPPSFYTPNYYETGLAMLQLAARVSAEGGDINSGEDLNAALEANPTFASVYGGDGDEVGILEFDTKTHDPKVRPVGLFRASDFAKLASWNIGGSDFQMTTE